METLLYFIAIGLAIWAQVQVKNKYAHFSQVSTRGHRSGAEIARSILDNRGLKSVEVLQSQSGVLTDHFDPKTNTVHLSPKVYQGSSIASVSIAAHEVGHAIQYAENYSFISARNTILPLAIVSGHLAWIVAIIGLMTQAMSIFYLGIAMLLVIASFQLLTLPIEFDASARALSILRSDGYLDADEIADSKSMLSAAALTYVAALLATLLQILRLIMISNRRKD